MNNLLDMEHAKALCCSSISVFFARTPHIHLEKEYQEWGEVREDMAENLMQSMLYPSSGDFRLC